MPCPSFPRFFEFGVRIGSASIEAPLKMEHTEPFTSGLIVFVIHCSVFFYAGLHAFL